MTLRTITFLSLGAIACLCGCSLAPKYQRPQAPIPAEWPAYSTTQPATQPSDLALPGWRDFFTDEKLQQIIGVALTNNRDLRLAALNVQRAQGLYGIQRAELLPTVDASAGLSRQRIPGDLSGGDAINAKQYRVDLGVTAWEIDFFGRIRSLTDAALQEYLATEQGRRSAQISLVSEVASAYLTLAADQESLALAQSTLKSQQDAYDLIKRRLVRGLAPEVDLFRAQTQVNTARVDVLQFTRRVELDRNALNLLAGAPVPADLLPQDLAQVAPPADLSPGVSSEVLLNRPDILQAEDRLRAAYANIGAARAVFFPRISLTAAAGTASSDLSGLFGSGSGTWTFAPQAVMPVFDARTWSALKVSKVDREIAVTQYERTIQSGFREVADALAVQSTVGQQVAAQESLVRAVAETYRLSSIRYERGIDTYLDVLDAQRNLYSAQEGLIILNVARRINQVRLYAVLGGGWQDSERPQNPANP